MNAMNVSEKQSSLMIIEKNQSDKTQKFTPEEIQKQQRQLQYTIAALMVPPMVNKHLTSFGFCLSEWMPEIVMNTATNVRLATETVSLPLGVALSFLPEKTHFFSSLVVYAPVGEEILFRGIIQEILMKKAPVALLQKINPQLANWVQSNKYAKIGRVALSTLLFSLAHLGTENCAMSNRPINVIGLGAVLGLIVEMNGLKQGLKASIFAHAINNLFVYGIHKFTGISADPIFDLE